jgi:hypothetical protein
LSLRPSLRLKGKNVIIETPMFLPQLLKKPKRWEYRASRGRPFTHREFVTRLRPEEPASDVCQDFGVQVFWFSRSCS